MKQARVRNLFVTLAVVAFGQVLWWAALLIRQQHRIAELEGSSGSGDPLRFTMMVAFEGLFFTFVWFVGMWFAYKSFKEQAVLRKAHMDFVGAVTHELKTPITNIQLCLDTLERPALTEEMKSRYFSRANQALSKLLNNVEAILALDSSVTRPASAQEIDLDHIIKDCLDQLDPSGLDVKYQSANIPRVSAPPEETRLILHNLIDNAIKYSQTGSGGRSTPVEISVDRQSNLLTVSIRDYGVGLTEEELAKVFEPFWRSP